jgi:hypothetical protein
MLKAIGAGDTVVVTRLDRMARSTLNLLHTMDLITKAEAGFRSLADAWADTTTPHGKLMLTVLGGLAEFERSLIMSRTQAGIQQAKERGVTFGRPTKLNAKQRRIIGERYAAGEPAAALAREFRDDLRELTVGEADRRRRHDLPSLSSYSFTNRPIGFRFGLTTGSVNLPPRRSHSVIVPSVTRVISQLASRKLGSRQLDKDSLSRNSEP